MKDKDIQQLVRALEPLLEQKVKEAHSTGLESGNKESSNLAFSIKEVVTQRLDEISKHLSEIKEQTTKTNGRVNSLENSRSYLWGSVAVLLLLGGTIAGLLWNAIDIKIKSAVQQALIDNVSNIYYEK